VSENGARWPISILVNDLANLPHCERPADAFSGDVASLVGLDSRSMPIACLVGRGMLGNGSGLRWGSVIFLRKGEVQPAYDLQNLHG
jgi:hypothetical protein